MRQRWITICLALLLLCGCGAAGGYSLTAGEGGKPVAVFNVPDGFTAAEDGQSGGFLFRHDGLGEFGYMYVGALAGDYLALAEEGYNAMLTSLPQTDYTEIEKVQLGGMPVAYYTMQYDYDDQAETGTCYARVLTAYVSTGDDAVLIMVNAVALAEAELCSEAAMLEYLTQAVESLS